MRRGFRLSIAGVWLLLLAPAVASGGSEAPLHGEGRVVAVDRSRAWITVEHGPIGDVLEAGRTEFPVHGSDLLQGVRVDDRVTFALATPPEGHGLLSIADLRVLGREPLGGGLTAGDAGMVALAALLAVVGGILAVQTRRLRRLVRASDAIVAGLREQVRLQREMAASVERAAAALLPLLRGHQSDLQRLGHRVQVALGLARGEAAGSREPARPAVIVRRGETQTFRDLQARLGEPGLARVIWDRRRRERRSTARPMGAERRRRERRGSLPVTWESLGYMVVEPRPRRLSVVA